MSVTVPIAKRVPLMPWVKVPAATITFCGVAETIPAADLPPEVSDALLHGLEVTDGGERGALVGIGVRPASDFVTYGVGVSLLGMRDTELARGLGVGSREPSWRDARRGATATVTRMVERDEAAGTVGGEGRP